MKQTAKVSWKNPITKIGVNKRRSEGYGGSPIVNKPKFG